MDKYMIRIPASKRKKIDDSEESSSESDLGLELPEKTPALSDSSSAQSSGLSGSFSAGSRRMRSYKDNLSYDSKWKKKYPWMDYYSGGMVCTVCKMYGKVPIQAKGAWVSRPVSNWVKATALLAKHDKSDWHKAAMEKQSLPVLTHKHGDVVEQLISASEEQKQQNRDLITKLIRSLYFLVKHHILFLKVLLLYR